MDNTCPPIGIGTMRPWAAQIRSLWSLYIKYIIVKMSYKWKKPRSSNRRHDKITLACRHTGYTKLHFSQTLRLAPQSGCHSYAAACPRQFLGNPDCDRLPAKFLVFKKKFKKCYDYGRSTITIPPAMMVMILFHH